MTAGHLRRAALVVVLLLGVAAAYFAVRPPRQNWALPALTGFGRYAPWFAQKRTEWVAYRYAEVREPDALAACVAAWIRARAAGGPLIDEAVLQRDIVRVVQGLAAPEAAEYWSAFAVQREFRTDLADDPFVQACYHEMTGRTIPAAVDPQKLLSEFRTGHRDAVQRPVAVSTVAYLEVALSKPLSASAPRRPDDPFYARTFPQFSMYASPEFAARWSAPTTRALIRITRPRVNLKDVLEKYDSTPVCKFGCVVKTADDSLGILDVYMYFCPDEARWEVEIGSTAFGKHVFWAI